jgi:hypothetical protein
VANRGVRAPMIQVIAWVGLSESSHHPLRFSTAPVACRCAETRAVIGLALNGVLPHAALRGTRPRNGRATWCNSCHPPSARSLQRREQERHEPCRGRVATPIRKGGRASGATVSTLLFASRLAQAPLLLPESAARHA